MQDSESKAKVFRISNLHKLYQFLCRPNMVRNACFHGRGDAKSLVNAAEIEVHVVKRNRVCMVLDLLGETVR